jgi:hypothetical protein
MISAIEIYNKPDFKYREESFTILAINAWELLLKAYLFHLNEYKKKSIYVMEKKKKKNGELSSRLIPVLNRSHNPKTLSLLDVINKLKARNQISQVMVENILLLIDFRDDFVHFINYEPIGRAIQELGFATIKNYMHFIKSNKIEIDLTKYNFYLMPLAYIKGDTEIDSIPLSPQSSNYIGLLQRSIKDKHSNDDYDIAISIKVDINKNKSDLNALQFKNSSNGISVHLSDEEIKSKYPLDYGQVVELCKNRYDNFKQDKHFFEILKNSIKSNRNLSYNRKLDPNNSKSMAKWFYSRNVSQIFDQKYRKRPK